MAGQMGSSVWIPVAKGLAILAVVGAITISGLRAFSSLKQCDNLNTTDSGGGGAVTSGALHFTNLSAYTTLFIDQSTDESSGLVVRAEKREKVSGAGEVGGKLPSPDRLTAAQQTDPATAGRTEQESAVPGSSTDTATGDSTNATIVTPVYPTPENPWDPADNISSPASPVLAVAISLATAVYITVAVAGQWSRGWGQEISRHWGWGDRCVRILFSILVVVFLWSIFITCLLAGNPAPTYPEGPEEGAALPPDAVNNGPEHLARNTENLEDDYSSSPGHRPRVPHSLIVVLLLTANVYIVYVFWFLWGGGEPGDALQNVEGPGEVGEQPDDAPKSKIKIISECVVALARACLVLFVVLSSPTDSTGAKSVKLAVAKLCVWVAGGAVFAGMSFYLNGLVAHSQLISVLNEIIKDSPQAAAFLRKNLTFWLKDREERMDTSLQQSPGANLTLGITRIILDQAFPSVNVTEDMASAFLWEHGITVLTLSTVVGMSCACLCCMIFRSSRWCSPTYQHNYGNQKDDEGDEAGNMIELQDIPTEATAMGASASPAFPPPVQEIVQEIAVDVHEAPFYIDDLGVKEIEVDAEISVIGAMNKVESVQQALVTLSQDDYDKLRINHHRYFEEEMNDLEARIKGEKDKHP
jgi:hypothetical protein